MGGAAAYRDEAPTRAEIDAHRGAMLLEFGDTYCGFCRAAQPAVAQALAGRDGITHLKIADGRGRPLGRSFGVKLWPTLVFLQDGEERARLVRPMDPAPVAEALDRLGASTGS